MNKTDRVPQFFPKRFWSAYPNKKAEPVAIQLTSGKHIITFKNNPGMEFKKSSR